VKGRIRRALRRAQRRINAALGRATGFEIRKVGARRRYRPPDSRARLLSRPTFILSTVRSGSTLLRVLLNSHSQICAPGEFSLRDLAVSSKGKHMEKAMSEIGLDERQLEYVLWDWILNRELEESGKRHLVRKTPTDVFIADRIVECWPDARFIFLLRHPAAVARSRQAVRPQDTPERNARMVLRYAKALEDARSQYDGITVRYEDLTLDPRAVTQEICSFLGLPWEPQMLDYGRFGHGSYRAGLGDWKDKIRSGQVQPPAPPPPDEEIPPELREVCVAWGYAREPAPASSERVEVPEAPAS
jgi:hypothetical protein